VIATRGWRLTELGLLAYPAVLVALGLTWLGLRSDANLANLELRSLWPAGVFAVLLAVSHLWLRQRLPYADQIVLPSAAGLVGLGLVAIYRLSPNLGERQLVWIGVGTLALMAATALLPSVTWLKRYRYSLASLGLLLVVVTLVLGIDPNGSGARLWFSFGGIFFQPSELLKLVLVVFFAAYLDDYRELLAFGGRRLGPLQLPPLPYLAPILAMFALSQMILFWQRDLGAALLFFGIFLSMLYVASGRASFSLLGGLLFVAGALCSHILFDHVRLRVGIWLDPWSQADGAGYQLVQALYALGSGGLLGRGLGAGAPGYVPAVQTDFIIVAIGEELGLAGTLAVVGLYLVLVERGLRLALDARERFAALLATGLTVVLALQALVILGGTLRLMPLTGITLPFVSYGGSSILANFMLLGILLRISNDEGRRRGG
jgi:cell division protein FtsW (lipid II flippase)